LASIAVVRRSAKFFSLYIQRSNPLQSFATLTYAARRQFQALVARASLEKSACHGLAVTPVQFTVHE